MKNSFRTLFHFLAAAALLPAGENTLVQGVVLDEQRYAIPGAEVVLAARDNSSRLTTTADDKGHYEFRNVAEGFYLLQAEAPGFSNSPAKPLEIGRGDAKSVELMLTVAGLQTQVVVTATGTPQTADEVSKAVTVVDAQTAALRGEFSLSDALRDVPGMRITRLGGPGGMTSFKMRGLRSEDTAVLIDGFRVRDASATQGDASAVIGDLLVTNMDRVEVMRGAGSSIYGSNATGGVVNIVTGEGGGRTRGSLLVEGGSLALFRSRAQVAGAAADQKLQYSAGVAHLNVMSGIDGEDPARSSSAQGRLDYRFSPKARIYGRVFSSDAFAMVKMTPNGVGVVPATGIVDAVPLSPTELQRYQAGIPVSELNLGGATYIPSALNPDSTRASRVFSGALGLSFRPSDSVGITATYQGLTTRRHFGDGPAGVDYQPSGSSLSYYDGDIHTANARVDWQAGRNQSINAGYEFENENYGNRSVAPLAEENSQVSVTQRSHSVFAQDQVRLLDGRLQLAGSYRAQFFSLRQPSFVPSTSAPYAGLQFDAPPTAQTGDGSAAYTFARSGTKLRAHVGKGYRAPSLYERFGSYYSSYGYSNYGDPRLRPDRSVAADGGVDQHFGTRARLSATYFYTWLQQVVVFDSGAIVSPVTDPYGRFGGYRNTDGGIARGVEMSGSVSATRTLSLTGAYTYTKAQERTPLVGNLLQTYVTPVHQYSFSATERFSSRLTAFFSLVGTGDYLAPIYNSSTYSSRAYRFDGIQRAEVGANYRLPLGEFRALRFTGKVDNAFNQRYFESGYRTPRATAVGGMQFEF